MNFPGGIDTSNTSYNVDHTGAPIRVGPLHQNRPSNPFAKNQQYYNNNQSYLSSNGGIGTHPSNSTYQPQIIQERPRSGMPAQKEAHKPLVGDYQMGSNNEKNSGRREKNLHELAQSNSYTYTLQ